MSENNQHIQIGPSRSLAGAQEAYILKDPEASIKAHSSPAPRAKEAHGGDVGDYIQSIVFGGLDGLITTFAVVMAGAAAGLSHGLILIVGFANLLGDAFGMAVGDFLSSNAEDQHLASERRRERFEIEYFPELEKQEMIDIYLEKGLSVQDATEVVTLLFESKEAFLDVMMIQELGLMPPDKAGSAVKSAIFTFFAFMVFGGLPLIPYAAGGHYTGKSGLDIVFWIAIGVFAVALFTLGSFKGYITGKRWWFAGMMMFVNGMITTLAAYYIGFGLEKIADLMK